MDAHTAIAYLGRHMKNGGELEILGPAPRHLPRYRSTGFNRDGPCPMTTGAFSCHGGSAGMAADIPAFTRGRDNELSRPLPRFEFPGFKPGSRRMEAAARGAAPLGVLGAAH